MRAWLLQGERTNDQDRLSCALRQWASRSENCAWTIESLRLAADIASVVQAQRPDVLLLAEPSCPAGPWVAEMLTSGIGLIVATSLQEAESYQSLAERYAIQLIPLSANAEGIGLAIVNVLSHAPTDLAAHVDQLQQRLKDRIIVERAKGILVDRLHISEKDAYQKLRVLSRQKRQPIRDIAQFVLDAKSLFLPELNGFASHAHRDEPPMLDRPRSPL